LNSPLIYHYDEACTKRCPVNEHGVPIIDWGETIPGQLKETILYLKNKTEDRLILRQPYSNDEDHKIVDYPPMLMGKEKGRKVVLHFEPNSERIDPLKTDWGFDVVIG